MSCKIASHHVCAQALPSDREKEELLTEHLKERERKEAAAQKADEKKRRAAYRELLESSTFIKVEPAPATLPYQTCDVRYEMLTR